MIMNMEYTYKWEWYDLGIWMHQSNAYIWALTYIWNMSNEMEQCYDVYAKYREYVWHENMKGNKWICKWEWYDLGIWMHQSNAYMGKHIYMKYEQWNGTILWCVC